MSEHLYPAGALCVITYTPKTTEFVAIGKVITVGSTGGLHTGDGEFGIAPGTLVQIVDDWSGGCWPVAWMRPKPPDEELDTDVFANKSNKQEVAWPT